MQVKPLHLVCRRGAQLGSRRGRSLVCKATDRVVLDIGDNPIPPWLFGFQCNERYLAWDESAHVQLLKIYAAKEMGKVGQQHCIQVGQKALYHGCDTPHCASLLRLQTNGQANSALGLLMIKESVHL